VEPGWNLKWNYTTAGAITGSPAICAEGTVYVGISSEGRVYAINSDGSLKWTYLTTTSTSGSPAIGADGTIYIGTGTYSQSGTFYAINSDGTLKWMSSLGDISEAVPAIASDGTVYIASYDGKVYAFPGVVTFTADQTAGPAPLAIQFTGTSSWT
jgi:outer membrane protein assembly factor BamB